MCDLKHSRESHDLPDTHRVMDFNLTTSNQIKTGTKMKLH